MARRRSMLEEFYGPAKAAQIRARSVSPTQNLPRATRKRSVMTGGDVRGFRDLPDADTVTSLTDEGRALLMARMEMAQQALENATNAAVTLAANYPALNWWALAVAGLIPPLGGAILQLSTPAAVRDSVVSTLRGSFQNGMVPLRRREMQDVLDGTITFDRWYSAVRTTAQGVLDVLSVLKDMNSANQLKAALDDVYNDVAGAITWTAMTIRNLGTNLPDPKKAAQDLTYLIYGGVALGAFILYKYATAGLRFLPPPRNG